MKKHRLVVPLKDPGVFRIKLAVLSLLFAIGCIAGWVAHRTTAGANDQQLRDYILHYARFTSQQETLTVSALSVIGVYFRYPLVLLWIGFSAIGILLVPILLLAQGFSVAFSVACFSSAFGRNGLALSAIVFGFRYCLLLPVTLFLAVCTWNASMNQLGQRNGRREQIRFSQKSDLYLRFAVCAVILLAGAVFEWVLIPKLFKSFLLRMM